VLINSVFASELGDGPTFWLTVAFRLMQLPLGLFKRLLDRLYQPLHRFFLLFEIGTGSYLELRQVLSREHQEALVVLLERFGSQAAEMQFKRRLALFSHAALEVELRFEFGEAPVGTQTAHGKAEGGRQQSDETKQGRIHRFSPSQSSIASGASIRASAPQCSG